MADWRKRAAGRCLAGVGGGLAALRLLGPRRRGAVGELPARPAFLLAVLDHLGDAVLATAVPPELKARFPEARVTVLCRPATAPVFRGDPAVDEVWLDEAPWFGPAPLRGFLRPRYLAGLAALLRRIRRAGFAAVLDLRGDLRHLLLLGLARPPVLLGHLRTGGAGLVTVALPWREAEPENAKRRALAAALGGREPAAPSRPRIVLAAAERAAGAAEVAAARAGRPGPAVLVDPGGKPVQRWPAARFAALAAGLGREPGGPVLVGAGPGQEALAREVVAGAAGAARFLPPAPGPRELAARVAACALVVANDTGVVHVAGAVGVRTVALFGPTDPARFWWGVPGGRALASPLGCGERALHERCRRRPGPGPGACLEEIAVEEVLAAAREALRP